MARIIVISRRRTVYGPARVPVEVEQTPRVNELIRLGVLYRPHTEAKPVKKATAAKKATSTPPAPVVGVTSAPAGKESLVSEPLDHEGEEAT